MNSFLISFGLVNMVLFLPSGVLHYYLGPYVYIRDGLVFLHFILACGFLTATRQISQIIKTYFWLVLFAGVFLPLLNSEDRNNLYNGIVALKWVVLWLDHAVLGYIIFHHFRCRQIVRWLVIILATYILFEALAGLYELRSGSYIFNVEPDAESAFGNMLMRSDTLEGVIRVRGFQRAIFQFANLMGVGVVLSGIIFTSASGRIGKGLTVPFAVLCLGMLVFGGGRSSIFGTATAVAVFGILHFSKRRLVWSKGLVLVGIPLGLLSLIFGMSSLSKTLSDHIFPGLYFMGTESAFMRQENWMDIMGNIRSNPQILLVGAPWANMFDRTVPPFQVGVDNMYLWILYHGGVLALIFWILLFWQFARDDDYARSKTEFVVCISFMAFLLSEGFVRESFFFPSSLCFFFVSGMLVASRVAAGGNCPRSAQGMISQYVERKAAAKF
jgi:hypothetical protein